MNLCYLVDLLRKIIPRQIKAEKAVTIIRETVEELIAKCKEIVDAEGEQINGEDYVNDSDPSILRFLLATHDEVSSVQLRDDLLSMLVAGHETTGSVLTWTLYLLSKTLFASLGPLVVADFRLGVDFGVLFLYGGMWLFFSPCCLLIFPLAASSVSPLNPSVLVVLLLFPKWFAGLLVPAALVVVCPFGSFPAGWFRGLLPWLLICPFGSFQLAVP
ncbi:hypothetical protein IEQ34_008810 [Dendrobium chrysotoxum]|uniref:Uncharacterized protein n=1 Tax=Dendrobium chrysotoxum TaxID=161865 RepID=A0AAV7GHH7_DENCH|nr:hypothetical protein IEQ34_008810 [Dendrobium chrysotoxum]